MASRYHYVVVVTCTALVFLTGCLTEHISQKKYEVVDEYRESVTSVLITLDRERLIVVGDKYTYVFENSADLINSISGEVRPYLTAKFNPFVVSGDKINGGIILILEGLPDSLAQQARNKGYRHSHDKNRMYLDLRPSGVRYITNQDLFSESVSELTQEYSVSVVERKTKRNTKLLLAPITIAIDGTLFAFGAALISVATVFSGPE